MKKKIISIVLALTLGLSLFGFVACGTDISSLEERIAQLEQELAEAREQDGIRGQDGLTPRIYGGYWWIGDTNTGVRAEGTQGTQGNAGTPAPQPNIRNGWWYVGDTPLNVRAVGQDGTPGGQFDWFANAPAPRIFANPMALYDAVMAETVAVGDFVRVPIIITGFINPNNYNSVAHSPFVFLFYNASPLGINVTIPTLRATFPHSIGNPIVVEGYIMHIIATGASRNVVMSPARVV